MCRNIQVHRKGFKFRGHEFVFKIRDNDDPTVPIPMPYLVHETMAT